MRRRFPWILTVVVLLSSSGCGYPGGPLVPYANIPARITDLAAVERGDLILVRFTIPTRTTEANPISKAVDLDLRIGLAGEKFDAAEWARQAKAIAGPETHDGVASYRIPAAEWVGKEVAIGARAVGANGKQGDWSNYETLHVVAPLATPSKPEVTGTAGGERLAWSGSGEEFRVLRRAQGEANFAVAATVKEHEWIDSGIEYGKPYDYAIQAIAGAGNQRTAESEVSPSTPHVPEDTFPPAVPAGLRADLTPSSVSIVWEPDTDADLAGYRLYRAEGGGPFQKLAEVSTVPSYTDTAVEHGKTYRYAVSAFDKAARPNESQRSGPVEVIFP